MDFAFVPGGTTIEPVLRKLMGLRPQTTLISKNGVVTIADFLSELQSHGNKADDLLLGKGRVSGNIQTNVDICFSHPTNRSTLPS
jgi:hypothetical protein